MLNRSVLIAFQKTLRKGNFQKEKRKNETNFIKKRPKKIIIKNVRRVNFKSERKNEREI